MVEPEAKQKSEKSPPSSAGSGYVVVETSSVTSYVAGSVASLGMIDIPRSRRVLASGNARGTGPDIHVYGNILPPGESILAVPSNSTSSISPPNSGGSNVSLSSNRGSMYSDRIILTSGYKSVNDVGNMNLSNA